MEVYEQKPSRLRKLAVADDRLHRAEEHKFRAEQDKRIAEQEIRRPEREEIHSPQESSEENHSEEAWKWIEDSCEHDGRRGWKYDDQKDLNEVHTGLLLITTRTIAFFAAIQGQIGRASASAEQGS